MIKFILILAGIILFIIISVVNDAKSKENKLESAFKMKSDEKTDYKDDALLLLSILKDIVNCSDSKIFSETEKERIRKKWLSIEENQLFKSCSNSKDIFPIQKDGIETPEVNWIKKKDNMQLTEAVNLYIEMKEYINYCESDEDFDCPWIWYFKTTFFVTEEDVQLSNDEKEEFIKKCRTNNIHIVKHPKEFEFIDIFDSTKYELVYFYGWGSADDAATYVYYDLKKIDSEAKTDKEKLSDKILNKMLNSYSNKEYFNDASLNQINMKIPLDEKRLYFLTVYVDDTTGLIKKFSFDIEAAYDTHYEFDVYGAEKLRNSLISRLPDINRNIDEALNTLLKEYLNKYNGSLLISLIKSISTAVFHFD